MSVTLVDLKAHLNVTFDLDDPMLADQLAAAKAWVSSYIAGDVDADGTPTPVDQAVLMLCAHLYANREATLVGITSQVLPFGFLDLLSSYRAFAF